MYHANFYEHTGGFIKAQEFEAAAKAAGFETAFVGHPHYQNQQVRYWCKDTTVLYSVRKQLETQFGINN